MADLQKYQTKEVLNKVLNTGEDALKVDIDNVTLITEGSDVNIEVHTDKAEDSMMMWTHTVKTGTGGTSYVPLIDSDGHLQVYTLSSALPSGAATAANQTTIIGHVDGIETLITSTNSKIDTFDAVLDSSLTKQGEIDTAIDSLVTANHSDLLAVEASLTSMEGKQDTQVTHLSEIEGAVEAIEGAIDGSQMQVDIVADGAGLATDANLAKMLYGTGLDITALDGGPGDQALGATYESLYVGVGGNVVVTLAVSASDFTFVNVASGQMLPIQITHVKQSGTTATNMIAMKA